LRLTEIFLKAYGEKLGGLRSKISIRREILLPLERKNKILKTAKNDEK